MPIAVYDSKKNGIFNSWHWITKFEKFYDILYFEFIIYFVTSYIF